MTMEADGHELPVVGRRVSQIQLTALTSNYLRIVFWGHDITDFAIGLDYELNVEGRLQYRDGAMRATVDDVDGAAALAPKLLRKVVRRARAEEQGGLVITFTDDATLEIPAAKFEPWQFHGEDGSLWVSVAGGGISIWGPSEGR